MPAPIKFPPKSEIDHTPVEDAQGLISGCAMISLGFVILTNLGFLTGQSAGIALIISYVTGFSFGLVFFLFSLPFYIFAYFRLGLNFTLKSIICVAAVSVTTEYLSNYIRSESIEPFVGMIVYGIVTG